jgi:hypothetical protein
MARRWIGSTRTRVLHSNRISRSNTSADDLAKDIEYLGTFAQTATAGDLGLTERGRRKVVRYGQTRKRRQ